jgi:hypothetical protein
MLIKSICGNALGVKGYPRSRRSGFVTVKQPQITFPLWLDSTPAASVSRHLHE